MVGLLSPLVKTVVLDKRRDFPELEPTIETVCRNVSGVAEALHFGGPIEDSSRGDAELLCGVEYQTHRASS
jgi:hypothetical protein